MNEAETRAELIDPALKEAGWSVVDGSRVRREDVSPWAAVRQSAEKDSLKTPRGRRRGVRVNERRTHSDILIALKPRSAFA